MEEPRDELPPRFDADFFEPDRTEELPADARPVVRFELPRPEDVPVRPVLLAEPPRPEMDFDEDFLEADFFEADLEPEDPEPEPDFADVFFELLFFEPLLLELPFDPDFEPAREDEALEPERELDFDPEPERECEEPERLEPPREDDFAFSG